MKQKELLELINSLENGIENAEVYEQKSLEMAYAFLTGVTKGVIKDLSKHLPPYIDFDFKHLFEGVEIELIGGSKEDKKIIVEYEEIFDALGWENLSNGDVQYTNIDCQGNENDVVITREDAIKIGYNEIELYLKQKKYL